MNQLWLAARCNPNLKFAQLYGKPAAPTIAEPAFAGACRCERLARAPVQERKTSGKDARLPEFSPICTTIACANKDSAPT